MFPTQSKHGLLMRADTEEIGTSLSIITVGYDGEKAWSRTSSRSVILAILVARACSPVHIGVDWSGKPN